MSPLLPPAARRARLDERHRPWRHRNLAQLFGEVAESVPRRPVVLTDRSAVDYGQMCDWSRRVAGGLAAAGIRSGDHVALLLSNSPEFIAAKLAIARLGAVAVPLNFNLRREELAYVLCQSRAVALIAMDGLRTRDYISDLEEVAPDDLRIWIDDRHGIAHRWSTFDELSASQMFDGLFDNDETSLSDILYTSGTTGRPKGVMLTHGMVLRTGFASARVRAFEDGRRLLFAAPLYHVHGYVECFVASLFAHGAIIMQEQFDPAAMLVLAREHSASEISGVPTLTERLLDAVRDHGFEYDGLTCVFNTGGANREGIWVDIRRLMRPAEIVTAYGMTETTASTVCTLPEDPVARLINTNGRLKEAGAAAPPGEPFLAQYRTIDPITGADRHGENGELVVRGASVTRGYFEKPEETAEAFLCDGWLRTGDLGTIDEDYLTLTGRIKETYRCGGETVMPREIEAVLESHPGVEQALVVGVADPKMGEVGCAWIVGSGEPVDSAALIALCEARLARFKVPRHVLFLAADAVPLTATGRPRKFQLAEMANERLGR